MRLGWRAALYTGAVPCVYSQRLPEAFSFPNSFQGIRRLPFISCQLSQLQRAFPARHRASYSVPSPRGTARATACLPRARYSVSSPRGTAPATACLPRAAPREIQRFSPRGTARATACLPRAAPRGLQRAFRAGALRGLSSAFPQGSNSAFSRT